MHRRFNARKPLFLSALALLPLAAHADGLVSLTPNFSVALSWVTDPDTGDDVLRGCVEYLPAEASPACQHIRFIQAARVETAPGKDFLWQGSMASRNQMTTAGDPVNQITPGFYIDHDAGKCVAGAHCSPYFRDSWPNAGESQDGSHISNSREKASLIDYPFGWTLFQRITLESCAQCVDNSEFYGCVHWGADWPNTGDRTIFQPSYSAMPSPTFLAALDGFLRFYKMK